MKKDHQRYIVNKSIVEIARGLAIEVRAGYTAAGNGWRHEVVVLLAGQWLPVSSVDHLMQLLGYYTEETSAHVPGDYPDIVEPREKEILDKLIADRYRALCGEFSDEEILHHDILHLHQHVARQALDDALASVDAYYVDQGEAAISAWKVGFDVARGIVERERDRYTAPPKKRS